MKTVRRLVLRILHRKARKKKWANEQHTKPAALCVYEQNLQQNVYAQFKFISMHSKKQKKKPPKIHSEIHERCAFFFWCWIHSNSMDISIESNKVQLIAILFRHSRTHKVHHKYNPFELYMRLILIPFHPILILILIPSARNNATLRFQSSVEYSFIYLIFRLFRLTWLFCCTSTVRWTSAQRCRSSGSAQLPDARKTSFQKMRHKDSKRRAQQFAETLENSFKKLKNFHFVACY